MPTIKLILDTRDAQLIQSTNSVKWNIGGLIRDIRTPINWIQYHSIEMPNLFYNIIDSNKKIHWEVYSTDGLTLLRQPNVNLPVGHYSQAELIAALETHMDAQSGLDDYSITADPITNAITISHDSSNQIVFKYDDSTIGNVLGFTQDSTKGASITGNRPFDLRGVTSFMIQSNIANVNAMRATGSGGASNTFFADVKLSEGYGNTIFYHNDNVLDIINVSRLPDSVTMELRNRNNVLLDNNNFHWRISLLVNY